MYFYASATIFGNIDGELRGWLTLDSRPDPKAQPDEYLEWGKIYQVKRNWFRKLKDKDGLYKILGNLICNFIRTKTSPFPGGLQSKKHFLSFGSWKRAFIFGSLYRYETELHANKHWDHYGYDNYKLGKYLFKRYCECDESILKQSTIFNNLPDDVKELTPTKGRKKKKKRKNDISLRIVFPGCTYEIKTQTCLCDHVVR